MSYLRLDKVYMLKEYRSPHVYGSYRRCPQWKAIPGSLDFSEVKSEKDLLVLWNNLVLMEGTFRLQTISENGTYVNLGKITYHNGTMSIKDKRCRLAKLLIKKKSSRSV